jgi:hypothetical protein
MSFSRRAKQPAMNTLRKELDRDRSYVFFTFPEDARWNAERQAMEFGVEIGECHGVVWVPRRVFQRLLPEWPAPERASRSYYLQRTRFEGIAERKLRQRHLTEDRI